MVFAVFNSRIIGLDAKDASNTCLTLATDIAMISTILYFSTATATYTCKSHYYSAGLSYYNFPYAFGGLFSRGLYAKYLEEGEAFLPKYRALLNATTVDTVENVALIAGIDLTKPEFWRKSLQMIADRIDEFIEVTSK